jgi:hypothetical protein
MVRSKQVLLVAVATLATIGVATGVGAQVEVQIPEPTVPELFTIQGQYTRIAYNNEGWVTLGYRTANDSQDTDWMLLEVGLTVRKPSPSQTMTRDRFSVKLPDGTMVPMATQREYQEAGSLRGLNGRANMVRDSINYFPNEANRAFAMHFFSDPAESRVLAFDQFEVSSQLACLGRLFFKLPEGSTIEPGQYWLVVRFDGSTVEVPFRIMTEEEEKYLKKNWKDLKEEHETFLKKEAEKARQQ